MPARGEPSAVSPSVEYEAVFRAAPDGFVVVDATGLIRDLNPAAERMFGYPREELLGSAVEVLVPERARPAHHEQRSAYLGHPRSRPMGIGMELSGRRKDGSEFPVEISLSPMTAGGAVHVIAAVRDVTERSRLRALGAGALRAAEEERQRIARELHDDTAQRLAALLVQIELASRSGPPAERRAMLGEVREGIERAADSVRRIAQNLRPPVLDEVGVVGAVGTYARSLRESFGIDVSVQGPPRIPRLAPDLELALYRIIQEALSNVVRHADVEAARVTFALDGGELEIVVEDEGAGFDPAVVERRERGLGLLGMRERARNAGARLDVTSRPGEGTQIRLRRAVETPRG